MGSDAAAVTITLRIPGTWGDPGELVEQLPDGCRLTPDTLTLADGSQFEFIPMPPDDQFARIFRSSCRGPLTEDESSTLEHYRVNIGLRGPGGSMEAALRMMRAAVVILDAGAAGVFVDNSALAHGATEWREIVDNGSCDAISYAFTSIIRGSREVYTMGMGVMGLPDFGMSAADAGPDAETMIQVIRSVCGGNRSVETGQLLTLPGGTGFKVAGRAAEEFPLPSPMHNPGGRLTLINLRDIAAGN